MIMSLITNKSSWPHSCYTPQDVPDHASTSKHTQSYSLSRRDRRQCPLRRESKECKASMIFLFEAHYLIIPRFYAVSLMCCSICQIGLNHIAPVYRSRETRENIRVLV